jgi:hypothetical protein
MHYEVRQPWLTSDRQRCADLSIESERKSKPYNSPDRRFLRARRVRLALGAKQINGQHAEHAGVKGDPEPEIRAHLNLI